MNHKLVIEMHHREKNIDAFDDAYFDALNYD